jgi:hypothetical protein
MLLNDKLPEDVSQVKRQDSAVRRSTTFHELFLSISLLSS